MALVDDAKIWLRVSTGDEAITSQIALLCDAAISDLCNTADVDKNLFDGDEVDPLLVNAVMVYVQAMWTDNEDRQAKLMVSYDSIKTKLVVSSKFNGSEG